MVETIDLAIIFKRTKDKNDNEYFTPFKIVEGYYDEEDELFVDKSDNTYHHICEFINNGNVFGCRKNISKLIAKNPNITYNELKRKLLLVAKDFKYIRKNDNQFEIIVVSSEQEERKYQDIDTRKHEEYIDGPFENSQEEQQNEQRDKELSLTIANSSNNKISNPQEIYDIITKRIIGQDEAIKTIITTIILNNSGLLEKNNMLVIGPTGVGKTAIFLELSKILEIPLTIFSVPGLSQAGYVGRSVDEILKEIILNSEHNIEKAERSLVILDEIDKLSYKGYEDGKVSTSGVQNELLKLIEGQVRWINISGENYRIDTSNITFIGVGAFQELYENNKKTVVGFESHSQINKTKINNEKIVDLGFKRELVGRLPVLVELNSLTKDNIKDILKTEGNVFYQNIKKLEELGIICENIDDLYELIAEDALTKGLGARGIKTTTSKIFSNIFYEVLSNPDTYESLIIGENILTNPKDFTLYKKRVKKKVRI